MKRNYGFALTFGIIAAFLIFIPVFIFGIGAVIKAFQFMFSPVTSGSIPIWVIFAIGLFIIIAKRRGWF
jgi:hypothetical protein